MLTTIARVTAELRGTETAKLAGTDQLLLNYIRTVSRRIQNFGWSFEPVYYTRKITATPSNVDSAYNVLTLGDYTVELDSVVNDGTALSIGDNVFVYPGEGQYPIKQLRLVACPPCLSWYPRNCSPCPAIETVSVTGWWATHQYPDGITGGWLSSEDNVQNVGGINSAVRSITVSNVDGDDSLDRTPRFSPGNLLRIDDEMLLILDDDTTGNTLTVQRGVNRSVAASHAQGASILIWEAESDVISMATRQVGLLYARRGAYMKITTDPSGMSVEYPADLLWEIKNTLAAYNYV